MTYRTNLTEKGNIGILNPFTHTKEDNEKIKNFDVLGKSKEKKEKVKVVDGTHCTLIMVGGKYLQKISSERFWRRLMRSGNGQNIIFINWKKKNNIN